jgi:hypothetical protein
MTLNIDFNYKILSNYHNSFSLIVSENKYSGPINSNFAQLRFLNKSLFDSYVITGMILKYQIFWGLYDFLPLKIKSLILAKNIL